MIDKYKTVGQPIPNNNSNEALHADHVWPILEQHLQGTISVDAWVNELRHLATVVCVTASENYRLIVVEKTTPGPEKYSPAGVRFTSPVPWAQ